MSQTPHQTLHRQLVQLRGRAKAWLEGGKPKRFYPGLGICSSLRTSPNPSPNYSDLLDDLLASWPGGSGSLCFPVPHPTKTPSDAFIECSVQEMWNPEFEYARNRWALLEWLIEQTKPAKEAA